MDTNKLKKFATEARNRLKAGVAAKIQTLGFDRNGQVPEHLHPQLMQGGSLWNGQLQAESFYHQWQALYRRVQQKGIKEVYEEAAYTWFNRLVAIRILQKNGLVEPALDYVDAARTPRIVDEARMGRIPQMPEAQRIRLMELLDDDARTTEQFALLIAAFCHDTPILQACFGTVSDFTELLLPNDILTEGGFVDMLNHTEFIADEDFRSPELIGWLYQFYISERKDEVFASFKKGQKAEAEDIPAATQIFTPNWIVKYMVQNTVGRIYLDNNPSATSEFKPKWKYLVESAEPTPKESIYKYKELTDLLVGDLACGSGHILNECFDILYDLYIYEGYSRREAIENIFTHNLRGVDLDTRAKQLATFALMLKACQKDASFADGHVLPHVLDMPQKTNYGLSDLSEFLQSESSEKSVVELSKAFELMKDADSLGSIMKFDLSDTTLLTMRQTLDYWHGQSFVPEKVEDIIPAIDLILSLTDKYSALIANPPYMGRGNMNQILSSYLDKEYPITKQDLYATFMKLMLDRTVDNGRTAFITMESWMFLTSFENLRRFLLDNYYLSSMGHFGWHIIGIAFGTVMSVFQKCKSNDRIGEYSFLTIDDIDKEKNVPYVFPKKDNGRYSIKSQKDFEKIPRCPIGYWVGQKIYSIFEYSKLYEFGSASKGIITGDNKRFLRIWSEVSNKKIQYNAVNYIDSQNSDLKWYPCRKGGLMRKWYGNNEYVINWLRNGYEVIECAKNENRNCQDYANEYKFVPSISWTSISGGSPSFRFGKNDVAESAGMSYFLKDKSNILYSLGFLNSRVSQFLLQILNPTVNYTAGTIESLPLILDKELRKLIDKITLQNTTISKLDWDSHETSWDFQRNPLLEQQLDIILINMQEQGILLKDATIDDMGSFHLPDLMQPLEILVENYKAEWEDYFYKLHSNEEELNRQFICIYGLEDELTPDVPLDEITILQQGEISINNNQLIWHEDVLMKQLISYAVGVWMGRYRLDKKGLHIAHPDPTDEELQSYTYNGNQVCIDDDAIIPILPQNSPFDDNLSSRISDFIRIVFGEERLTENLNYIEQKLNMTIDQYVQKDFWKDHKKMYQNRPIYWLFSSKKGAFKCLTYMHRMDAYTAERVRTSYLLPYIEFLQNQIAELENRASTLSTAENRKLQNLQKSLDECREYHERLQVVAEHAIAFDLDDGVVVNYAKFGDTLAKIK